MIHVQYQKVHFFLKSTAQKNFLAMDLKKALKLPTLLEGEPLSIWLEATEKEQAEFRTMKEKIITKMVPIAFLSLQEFNNRKMLLGEAVLLTCLN